MKKMFITFYHYFIYRGFYCSVLFILNSLKERLFFSVHRKSAVKVTDFKSIEKNLNNKKHATFYFPTPITPFLKLIQTINLPPQPVFVDYGAGKARAMLLAAESGFHKIKGLEFSLYLYNLGKINIEEYKNRTHQKSNFELLHIDVCDYEVKIEDNFFYFFHPFNEMILKRCLKNIYTSLKKNPRFSILVYHSNIHNQTNEITDEGVFKLKSNFKYSGSTFYVYQTSI